MSNVGPDQQTPGRTLRARLVWWLTVALMLAMVPLLHSPSPAMADDACFLDVTGAVTCHSPGSPETPQPALLNAAAYRDMTTSQAAALHRFEQMAVTGVVDAHGLPPGDAVDVRLWARDEVLGALQSLVFQAIGTPADERTPDQQQAADWMGNAATARITPPSLQAGAEYASWAGFDLDRYWSLVRRGASTAEMTAFLGRHPEPYSTTSSTGGYCRYVPPAPYQDDYEGRSWPTCFAPCANPMGNCEPTVTREDMLLWGRTRTSRPELMSKDVVLASAGISGAATYLGTMIGGSLLGAYISQSPAFAEVAKALMPASNDWDTETSEIRRSQFDGTLRKELNDTFFSDEGKLSIRNLRDEEGALLKKLHEVPDVLPTSVRSEAALKLKNSYDAVLGSLRKLQKALPELATELAQARLGFTVDAIMFAIDTAVTEGVKVIDAASLPEQLATTASWAANLHVDARTLLLTPTGPALLRNIFANASLQDLPSPDDCADGCADPAPVRAASSTDPEFLVQSPGDATWRQTPTLRLGNVVDDEWVPSSVRVSGKWFVERWLDPDYGPHFQAIMLNYTNWDMKPETAWLLPQPDGGYAYRIVSPKKSTHFDVATCQVDRTCWTANSIQYLDPDGNPRIASLEAYHAPTGAPTASTPVPQPGQAVAFDSGHFSPGNPRGMVTYQWRFQQEGCATTCTIVKDGDTLPDYAAPVTGDKVSHIWQTPGTYQVEVTATDAVGHTAVKMLAITVGNG